MSSYHSPFPYSRSGDRLERLLVQLEACWVRCASTCMRLFWFEMVLSLWPGHSNVRMGHGFQCSNIVSVYYKLFYAIWYFKWHRHVAYEFLLSLLLSFRWIVYVLKDLRTTKIPASRKMPFSWENQLWYFSWRQYNFTYINTSNEFMKKILNTLYVFMFSLHTLSYKFGIQVL